MDGLFSTQRDRQVNDMVPGRAAGDGLLSTQRGRQVDYPVPGRVAE